MDRVGRYELLRELGRGAMGVVHEARDPRIDRVVAIKCVLPSEDLPAQARELLNRRFLNEAKAAGRLSHPYITTIFDQGIDPATGMSYIVMELVRGRDLESHFREGRRFSAEEAAELAAMVAEALDYSHLNGVVHRDIKPGNLMLPDAGGVKVTDFGIARLEASSLTRTGQILGSPAYMSPEQITGAPVDGRSDIFSLGVVLYRLLTDERPFTGDTVTALTYKIVHTEPTPARTLNPALPPSIDPILRRALAKSPHARYARAGDFAAELRSACRRDPTLATFFAPPAEPESRTAALDSATGRPERPPSPGPAAAPAPDPWRRRIYLAIAAAALLAGGAVLGQMMSRPDDPRGRPNQQAGSLALASPTPEAPASPVPTAIATATPGATRTPSPTPIPSSSPRPSRTRTPSPPPAPPAAPPPAPGPTGLVEVHIKVTHHRCKATLELEVEGLALQSFALSGKKPPFSPFCNGNLAIDLSVPKGHRHVKARIIEADGSSREGSATGEIQEGSGTFWEVAEWLPTYAVKVNIEE